MTIYHKSVRDLLKEFVISQQLAKGQTFSKNQILIWFSNNYPKIKQSTITAHLIMMSVNATSRAHYNLRLDGYDDVFYQISGSRFRLYDAENDSVPIYEKPQNTRKRDVAPKISRNRTITVKSVNIEKNLHKYIFGSEKTQGIKPLERYASFDYCFNYFQSFKDQNRLKDLVSPEHIQESCLQLGFYLASWGMLRGSTFLFEKSAKVYEPLISAIANADETLWEIDANSYSYTNISLLLDFRKIIIQTLNFGNGPSDILVTKIMLGVFGNVPAFDSYFKKGFSVSTFNRQALEMIAAFYKANDKAIENSRLVTLNFLTGQPTDRLYTRAKIIDMVFFIEGGYKD